MKVAVIFGSQRPGGTHNKIEEMITSLNTGHIFDFIRMHEIKIEGCIDCCQCETTGCCALPASESDLFHNVVDRLVAADAILLVTPTYAPIPSRLTALFERLLSSSFYPYRYNRRPRLLKGKKTAIITYDSGKIGDEALIKMIFQRFLMDDYGFTKVYYNYLNNVPNPNDRYSNVIEYVKDVVLHLN